MADIRDELRRIIAAIGEIDDPSTITDAASLRDLGVDSMMALEIVMEIEKSFGVQVPEARLREIKSLADAVRIVGELTSSRP